MNGRNLDLNTGLFIYCTKPIPRQNELPYLSSRLLSLYFAFECSSLSLKLLLLLKTDSYKAGLLVYMLYSHEISKLSRVSVCDCVSDVFVLLLQLSGAIQFYHFPNRVSCQIPSEKRLKRLLLSK